MDLWDTMAHIVSIFVTFDIDEPIVSTSYKMRWKYIIGRSPRAINENNESINKSSAH
jgi:hypothetical protein